MTPRFGLCGTAFWAEQVHLPGLMANPGLELVGIWGRTPDRTAALADRVGVRAFASFEQMLDHVDAVSFAVPPAVQATLAPAAIARGRHVLMEKPLGDSIDSAVTILRALAEHRVAGICFLTRMFVDEMSEFVVRARALAPTWGEAGFRSDALIQGPYAGSEWRQQEHGALWDAAPHGWSVLVSVLGPVAEIAASSAPDGTYAFSCRHQGGGTSTLDLNLRDHGVRLAERYRFGNGASVELPGLAYDRKATLGRAASLLLREIAGARDEAQSRLGLGLHLVCVATAAQHSLGSGGDFVPVAAPAV
ncbi:MAG: Gfo/Idh/MocA family oxidoreductase [Paracoccaceae bacterium]|nr:MAG: Gfo/Idh/MocA family oxidoreductase [Paracoccaceae bacterium]